MESGKKGTKKPGRKGGKIRSHVSLAPNLNAAAEMLGYATSAMGGAAALVGLAAIIGIVRLLQWAWSAITSLVFP
jgi:hypothetical protein